MKSERVRAIVQLGALLVIMLGAACTNSQELSSGAGQMDLRVEMANTSTRFGIARFDIDQFTVLPMDPQAQEELGTAAIDALNGAVDTILVDLAEGEVQFNRDTPLTVGRYRLLQIQIRNLEFRNGVAGGTTCPLTILSFPVVSQAVVLTDFGQDVYVDVSLSGANQLVVTFDGAALASAFENSWRCGNPLNIPCNGAPASQCVPRSNGFQVGPFSSSSATFLSFP